MNKEQPNSPLHGVKLEAVVTKLADHYGWEDLAQRIDINCFKSNPSIKSSLKFYVKSSGRGIRLRAFMSQHLKRNSIRVILAAF